MTRTPFTDFVREQHTRSTRAGILLAEYARQGVPILVTGRRYGKHASADALVSPDPSRPGAWRVTWCADGVPNDEGHVEAPTLFAGLVIAYRPGARLAQVTAETAPVRAPLLSAVRDSDDAIVVVDGRAWTISPVDDLVLVTPRDDETAPLISLRRWWLADDATLADAVRLAVIETGARWPVVADVATLLLLGATLAARRVTCGRIHAATDPRPRWGCYRDPGSVPVLGLQDVPRVEINERWGGFEIDHTVETDTTPLGAALAFVHEAGIAGALEAVRNARAEHPADSGACDVETPCPACARAYGLLDAAEGEEQMREEQAA